MAVKKPKQQKVYELVDEIASRSLVLLREVRKTESGINVAFDATIHPKKITYEVDAEGNKIDIYEECDLPTIAVTPQQLMGLFAIQVTLKDGTVSYIGEVLSNFADQLIALNIGATQDDVITTQHIDISSVIHPITTPTPPTEPPAEEQPVQP